jgi:membrane-bound acyltransferase YfiQ involved in biofilm formation
LQAPVYLLVIESDCWILSVFAFGYKYLNRPGRALAYLSEAAYPIYIVHMIFLFVGSMLIFPLDIEAPLKFILVLMFTIIGCFALYEFVIRRVNIIRPLFGLRKK